MFYEHTHPREDVVAGGGPSRRDHDRRGRLTRKQSSTDRRVVGLSLTVDELVQEARQSLEKLGILLAKNLEIDAPRLTERLDTFYTGSEVLLRAEANTRTKDEVATSEAPGTGVPGASRLRAQQADPGQVTPGAGCTVRSYRRSSPRCSSGLEGVPTGTALTWLRADRRRGAWGIACMT